MKTSFETATTSSATAAAPTTESSPDTQASAPATSSSSSAAVVESPANSSRAVALAGDGQAQVQGEISLKDIKLPRVNLVQKSGTLCDTFPPGSFCFGKEVPLGDGEKPFDCVFVTIKKQYQQDLPYDPTGPMPKVCDTAAEVRALGGNFQYGEAGFYKEMATALVLVPCPDGIPEELRDQHFLYEVEGRHWALGLWTLGGGAYTATAKRIMTAGMIGHLKTGFPKGQWHITSEKKSNARNSWFIPLAKPSGPTTPEFQEFVAELLRQGI